MIIPHYISFSKTNIRTEKGLSFASNPAHQINMTIETNQLPVKLSGMPFLKRAELQLWIIRNKQPSKIINTGLSVNELLSGASRFSTTFHVDLPDGKYQAQFAIPSAVPDMPTLNSAFIQLKLGKK
jgi:hypothetical protein